LSVNLARDEVIRTNFENYNLNQLYWDVMAADATHMPFRTGELFDAIVTDREFYFLNNILILQ